MNAQPLTPSNPNFNNFVQVIEPTIIRYTKAGRWFELHRTNAMLLMLGYDKGTSFENVAMSDLKFIIHSFHESHGFDVTQEVKEEAEEVSNEGFVYHIVFS